MAVGHHSLLSSQQKTKTKKKQQQQQQKKPRRHESPCPFHPHSGQVDPGTHLITKQFML